MHLPLSKWDLPFLIPILILNFKLNLKLKRRGGTERAGASSTTAMVQQKSSMQEEQFELSGKTERQLYSESLTQISPRPSIVVVAKGD